MKSGFIKVYYLPLYIAITLVIGIFLGKNIFSSNFSSFAEFNPKDSLYREAQNLGEVLQLVQENYVDSVDAKEFVSKSISDFLHRLDPHSAYVTASKVEKANETLEGSFEGIGLEFIIVRDTVMAVRALENGPSDLVGIQPGDQIVAVEKENISGIKINTDQVVGKLRGKRGSKVKILVKRSGESKLLSFTITRAEIPIHSVDAAYMLDSNTAYFKIGEFSRNTMDEFKSSYPYNNPKVKKVIMDLRGNGGGYLNTCTQLADEFLKSGEMIVYTKDRLHEKREMLASKEGRFEEVKLVVLIDHESASASEIFAGAMQDNDRGIIIGTRSFGKGLVQEIFNLSDGSQLRLTVSRYHTPSGRCIQKPYKDLDYETYAMSHYSLDTLKDSTVYYTQSKRKVYGGGGIYPDIVIESDTLKWQQLREVYKNDVIRESAIRFIVSNKTLLKAISEKAFISGAVDDKLNAFSIEKLKKYNLSEVLNKEMTKEVKANVARCLYGNTAFYSIRLLNDQCLEKAKSTK